MRAYSVLQIAQLDQSYKTVCAQKLAEERKGAEEVGVACSPRGGSSAVFCAHRLAGLRASIVARQALLKQKDLLNKQMAELKSVRTRARTSLVPAAAPDLTRARWLAGPCCRCTP